MITLTAMQPVKGPFKVYQTIPGVYRVWPSLRFAKRRDAPRRGGRHEALFQFHANAGRAAALCTRKITRPGTEMPEYGGGSQMRRAHFVRNGL